MRFILVLIVYLNAFLLNTSELHAITMEEQSADSANIEICQFIFPVDIPIRLLEKKLNEKFNGVLFDNTDEALKKEGFALKVQKKSDVKITAKQNVLHYSVPLQFSLSPGNSLNIFGMNLVGETHLDGAISLEFSTAISIDKNWNLKTRTSYIGYKWLKSPVVEISLVKIPISFFVDKILDTYSDKLPGYIDSAISKSICFPEIAKGIWSKLQEPQLIQQEYGFYLHFTPSSIAASSFQGTNEKLSISFLLKSKVSIKPYSLQALPVPLPVLEDYISDENDDVHGDLIVEISDKWANDYAEKNIVGKKIKDVTVETIKFSRSENTMVTGAVVSGKIKGSLALWGRPNISEDNKKIILEEMDFDLKTKNPFVVVADVLFHRKYAEKIQEQLVFPLDEIIKTVVLKIEQEASGKEMNGIKLFFIPADIHPVSITPNTQNFFSVKLSLRAQMKIEVVSLDF